MRFLPVAVLGAAELFVFVDFWVFALDVFVLRGGRRRRDAFAFVVLGRELRKAPRTSSSGSWAFTISRPQVKATIAERIMKFLDLICTSSD